MAAILRAMPPKPGHTPVSNFRIPLALKEEARQAAEQAGESLTDAVIEGLKMYIRDRKRKARKS